MPLPEERNAEERKQFEAAGGAPAQLSPTPPPAPPAPSAPAPTPAVVPQQQPYIPQGTGGFSSGGVNVGSVDTAHLNGDFRTRLMAMVAASNGKLGLASAYRSPELQAQLFARAVQQYGSPAAASKWVAPPGHSNHGKGIAADLTGDIEWAHQHAAEFGLYFPMSWEPWHIEPQGSRSGSVGEPPTTPEPNFGVDSTGKVSTFTTSSYSGPQASANGYTTPPNGSSVRDDPGHSDLWQNPEFRIGYLLSLMQSPEALILGGPQDFTSMPNFSSPQFPVTQKQLVG